jgi:hypothetical protein
VVEEGNVDEAYCGHHYNAELSCLTELSGIPQGSQGVGKLLSLELKTAHDL